MRDYGKDQIASCGRIVHYQLSTQDAEQVNRRRADAQAKMDWHRENKTGAIVHVGDMVYVGDIFPMIIVMAHTDGSVSGQVFLNGNDLFWVRHAPRGTQPGEWAWPPRM